jgi:hypothetical protein
VTCPGSVFEPSLYCWSTQIALYCTVLYCTVLYCAVLYCTVTVLYWWGWGWTIYLITEWCRYYTINIITLDDLVKGNQHLSAYGLPVNLSVEHTYLPYATVFPPLALTLSQRTGRLAFVLTALNYTRSHCVLFTPSIIRESSSMQCHKPLQ